MQKITALLLFLFLQVKSAFSQNIFIGDEATNRKLQWSDLRGRVDPNSPHHAVTTGI
ncbi:MAG: hypothetical protein IPJ31_12885 [Bacteroidetes bacterium]|nr:hypothetical protein [Bacteroidota bacterium]